jgi:DNA-binding transcriptional MerR regulator
MTTLEFCETAGLTLRELQQWLEIGLLAPAGMVGRTARGLRREFTADQAEHAGLLKVLHRKGVSLSRLAAVNLAVDNLMLAPAQACASDRTEYPLPRRSSQT